MKFIHIVRAEAEPDLDYESKWATLTFEIGDSDSASATLDTAAVAAVIDRFHRALASGDSVDVAMLLLADVTILESGRIESREEYLRGHLRAEIAFARAMTCERGEVIVSVYGDVAYASSTSVSRGEYPAVL